MMSTQQDSLFKPNEVGTNGYQQISSTSSFKLPSVKEFIAQSSREFKLSLDDKIDNLGAEIT